jgi:hypothetical protein
MKRLIYILLIFISSGLLAQTGKPDPKGYAIVQREDKLIINITSDNWTDLPSDVKSKPIRSRGFSFLLMSDRMNKSGNIGIGTGLGFMSQNVHTDAFLVDTTSNGSSYVLQPIPDSLNYKVNKLSLNFITAALEIRLRSNKNKSDERFKLAVGIVAGYLLQNHIKYEDKSGKYKFYDVKHLNKFQYGVEGRIGYSNYALCAYYSLADVFKDNGGPKLTPYSIGISFTF